MIHTLLVGSLQINAARAFKVVFMENSFSGLSLFFFFLFDANSVHSVAPVTPYLLHYSTLDLLFILLFPVCR